MGAAIFLLGIIGFLVLFCYLKFPPAYAKPDLVSAFNKMVLGVCVFFCAVWVWNVHTNWAGTPDEKWWLPIAILGALAIEVVFLGLCFLMRNFWIFKPPRRPGGGFGF